MSEREVAASPTEGHPAKKTEQDTSDTVRRARMSRCPSWKTLSAALPLLIALFLYNFPTVMDEYLAWQGYGEARIYADLPRGVMDQFRVYDTNGDGYLDPYEFVFLGLRFREESDQFQFEDMEMHPDREVVSVTAELQPLVLETMSKFKDKQEFYLGSPETILPGLLRWTSPQHPEHPYGVGNFRVFLPPLPEWSIGRSYYVVEPLADDHAGTHMNRYRPTALSGKDQFIYTLLSQFHPSVFVHSRFGPRGTLAVLRAQNDDYLDIVIRVHAEFQLNDEPNFPFWFTPAQFAGRLIIDRQAEHVEMFELFLPTDKQLNIDMEWMTGTDSTANEVDIGYMPEMRLYSVHPSEVLPNGTIVNLTKVEYDTESIVWREEIPLLEARQILERTLYPFKKVSYLPFLEAFRLALAKGKLVHSILLWGALDDQSC